MEIVNAFVEQFILFRFQFFKNNPRANLFVLKAGCAVFIVPTVTLSLVLGAGLFLTASIEHVSVHAHFEDIYSSLYFHLRQNCVQYVLGAIGACSVFYWNMQTIFNRKWQYCADLYNKAIAIEEKDKLTRDILTNALAMDLVVLDLWAHRSYGELFAQQLEQAIRSHHSDSENCVALILRANRDDLDEKEALSLLQTYQNSLYTRRSGQDLGDNIPTKHPPSPSFNNPFSVDSYEDKTG